MRSTPLLPPENNSAATALRVYLLGRVDFEAALALQRSLVYQVAGERHTGALVLCEHPPLLTVGRQGSPAQFLGGLDELRARRWPIRWVNRGGGSLLHLPGQFAVYSILPLDRLGLGVQTYLDRLQQVVIAVLEDFGVRAATRLGQTGVWVGKRLIAGIGVAVRDWVAYFGASLNVNPDLVPFRLVHSGAPGDQTMTSLERERRGPLRPALVRQRLVEHFADAFPHDRLSLFSTHPLLAQKSFQGPVPATA